MGDMSKQGLLHWLKDIVENSKCPGVVWDDQDQRMFRIPWGNQKSRNWKEEHCAIFRDYAVYTGKYSPNGGDKIDFPRWKQNLKSAINKNRFVDRVKSRDRLSGVNPYRVYQFNDIEHPKPKGTENLPMFDEGGNVISRKDGCEYSSSQNLKLLNGERDDTKSASPRLVPNSQSHTLQMSLSPPVNFREEVSEQQHGNIPTVVQNIQSDSELSCSDDIKQDLTTVTDLDPSQSYNNIITTNDKSVYSLQGTDSYNGFIIPYGILNVTNGVVRTSEANHGQGQYVYLSDLVTIPVTTSTIVHPDAPSNHSADLHGDTNQNNVHITGSTCDTIIPAVAESCSQEYPVVTSSVALDNTANQYSFHVEGSSHPTTTDSCVRMHHQTPATGVGAMVSKDSLFQQAYQNCIPTRTGPFPMAGQSQLGFVGNVSATTAGASPVENMESEQPMHLSDLSYGLTSMSIDGCSQTEEPGPSISNNAPMSTHRDSGFAQTYFQPTQTVVPAADPKMHLQVLYGTPHHVVRSERIYESESRLYHGQIMAKHVQEKLKGRSGTRQIEMPSVDNIPLNDKKKETIVAVIKNMECGVFITYEESTGDIYVERKCLPHVYLSDGVQTSIALPRSTRKRPNVKTKVFDYARFQSDIQEHLQNEKPIPRDHFLLTFGYEILANDDSPTRTVPVYAVVRHFLASKARYNILGESAISSCPMHSDPDSFDAILNFLKKP